MKSVLAVALLALSISFCNFGSNNKNGNANNAGNGNNTNSAIPLKDRFLGTWVASPDADFDGGPITFKSDGTYSAQRSKRSDSSSVTGSYEIRGDRLYCQGGLERETKDGFKMEGDRISLKVESKTVHFDKR